MSLLTGILKHRLRCIVWLMMTAPIVSVPAVAASSVPVQVITAQRAPVFDIERVTGSVISLNNASLSIRTAGLVDSLSVQVGDYVAQGDVLLRLNTELIEQQLKLAKAELSEAQAAQEDAQQQLTELETLAQQQNVAASEVRRARAQLSIANAATEAARARLSQAQTEQRQHQLKAPFSGWIVARHIDMGEWVNPGDVIYDLLSTDDVFVDFYLPQSRYAAVNDDVQVTLRAAHGNSKDSAATIASTAPIVDSRTRTFLTRVRPSAQYRKNALVGAKVTAEFKFEQRDAAVVIPRDAVTRYPDGRTAAWIIQDDTATERFIELGTAFDNKVAIVSGLKPGDRVVTRGNEALIEGQQVEIESRSDD